MPPDQPIRVFLVDDHEHVLWGLGKLIAGEAPRMAVVGTARSVPQALAELAMRVVDVVVLDVWLEADNSLEHLGGFVAAGAAVLVLTGVRDPEIRERALAGGARAVVLKEEPAEVLLDEIVRAHQWRCRRQDLH